MLNFEYCNPVRIVFGKGSISRLADLVPTGARVTLLYGGGSIRRNGVYEQVMTALQRFEVSEFSGIEANPEYTTCMRAVDHVREFNADFLLAAGGGSVLDATKFIAAAARFEGDEPWDILEKCAPLKTALPLGSVLTLPATGSEMNANSVISRVATQQKLHFSSPLVYPKFSILDPQATCSLPENQTRNGVVDAFIHVMEQYMTRDVNALLQDLQAEAVVKTLIEEAPKALRNPTDYDVRANLMWAATTALNGSLACGQVEDWATHMLGHELTAFYGIAHAESLAIVMPSLWRHTLPAKKEKLARFARQVFGVKNADDDKAAALAIERTEAFFHRIGMKTRMADYKIVPNDAADKVQRRFAERGVVFGENQDITPDMAAKILLDC